MTAIDDSLHVKHGDNLKNVSAQNTLQLVSTGEQVMQNPVHDPGRIRFTWMNSRCDENHLT
jgi:hypothetical protein